MRYSFHGKVRATGAVVDGHIEARSSSEAIDLLADRGIIGVYTVRPDPDPTVVETPALPALPAPVQEPLTSAPSEAALNQIVSKLTTLIGQVEKLIMRPVYAMPAPQSGGGGGSRRKRPVYTDNQNSALKDIFQSNLDLRRSLAKLTSAAAAFRDADATETSEEAPEDGKAEVLEPAVAGIDVEGTQPVASAESLESSESSELSNDAELSHDDSFAAVNLVPETPEVVGLEGTESEQAAMQGVLETGEPSDDEGPEVDNDAGDFHESPNDSRHAVDSRHSLDRQASQPAA